MNLANPLQLVVQVIVLWLLLGASGIVFIRNLAVVTRLLYPVGVAGSIALAWAGMSAIGAEPNTTTLPLGLPDWPFQLRIDSLSGFFLLLLGTTSVGVSIFSSGYLRAGETSPPGLQCAYHHVFIASMALVLVTNDAYSFMVFWEIMALSSYFLVVSDHGNPDIRRTGILYLVIAHLSALAILLSFGASPRQ